MKKIYQIPTISCLAIDAEDVLTDSPFCADEQGGSKTYSFTEIFNISQQ